MRRWLVRALGAALILGSGCATSDRRFLPVQMEVVDVRVPTQQLAVSEAAKRAAFSLDFSDFGGKVATVEVVGVFQHSYQELLDYVQTLVEARMALGGMQVRPAAYQPHFPVPPPSPPPAEELWGDTPPPPPARVREVRHYTRGEDADYRVVVAVGAAGADLRVVQDGLSSERYYDGLVSLVVAMIPLKQNLKPAALETTGISQQKIDGKKAGWFDDR